MALISSLTNVNATVLGFWIPSYFRLLAKVGLHLRIISVLDGIGGQLQDIKIKKATINLQPLYHFEMRLPHLNDFSQALLKG